MEHHSPYTFALTWNSHEGVPNDAIKEAIEVLLFGKSSTKKLVEGVHLIQHGDVYRAVTDLLGRKYSVQGHAHIHDEGVCVIDSDGVPRMCHNHPLSLADGGGLVTVEVKTGGPDPCNHTVGVGVKWCKVDPENCKLPCDEFERSYRVQ